MEEMLRELKQFYKAHGRAHLPWRATRDPYHILVSEVMLQQTQVERVIPFYNRFIARFPTARLLAKAPLKEVLSAWQGLGYNRRAKYLHEAAKIIVKEGFKAQLPGVGPYTRGAVEAFAFNKLGAFIETNIRTVFLHHLRDFKKRVKPVMIYHKKISDEQLLPLIAEALAKSKMEPREFYWALMDYGSHLKRQGVKLNHRAKGYVKQSKFEGSARQLRGAIIRELLNEPATLSQLTKKFSPAKSRGAVERELIRLRREGLLRARAGRYSLPH